MEAKFHNFLLLAISLLATQLPSSSSTSTIKKFHFNVSNKFKILLIPLHIHTHMFWQVRLSYQVEWKNITRLCHSKLVLTVNGKYPGPTIDVNEGDNVHVTVTNKAAMNTTIHWYVHVIYVLRNIWVILHNCQ